MISNLLKNIFVDIIFNSNILSDGEFNEITNCNYYYENVNSTLLSLIKKSTVNHSYYNKKIVTSRYYYREKLWLLVNNEKVIIDVNKYMLLSKIHFKGYHINVYDSTLRYFLSFNSKIESLIIHGNI